MGCRDSKGRICKSTAVCILNDHFVTSSLITRMTIHVNALQNMIISGFRPITRGPSLLIMGIGLSFYMNPKLAFVFVVRTPILAIILFVIVLVID